jgi:hypothetical protein
MSDDHAIRQTRLDKFKKTYHGLSLTLPEKKFEAHPVVHRSIEHRLKWMLFCYGRA